MYRKLYRQKIVCSLFSLSLLMPPLCQLRRMKRKKKKINKGIFVLYLPSNVERLKKYYEETTYPHIFFSCSVINFNSLVMSFSASTC